MKKEIVDLSAERKLITLLIMDTTFCKRISPILKPVFLQTNYAKLVSEWVLEYFSIYEEAPKSAIGEIWATKKDRVRDDETIETIGSFLESLSDGYNVEDYRNIEYHIDTSLEYIRANNINNLNNKLVSLITSGKIDEAESLIASYKRVGTSTIEGVSLLSDLSIIQAAFAEEEEALFRMPDALGKVAGPFYRGDFSLGLASQKAGKSWYLGFIGECALQYGNRVLHINLEMREAELYQRAWKSLTWQPSVGGMVTVPFFIPEVEVGEEITDTTMYNISSKTTVREGVSFLDKEYLTRKLKMKYRGGDIRYMTLPSSSTTVPDIENVLDSLAYYNNYVPDVLVIDYPDLLGSKEREYRHKLNDVYENLRRIAQERHIHVAGVSQTNKSGLKGEEITAQDLAEDIRKASHVAKLLGLFGTEEDRQSNFIYVKHLLGRYRQETYDTAVVLQQLDIGRWYIDSKLRRNVIPKK